SRMRLLVAGVLTLAHAHRNGRLLALEAYRTGERHDLDRARTVLAQCRCGCGCGRAGRVHVVDKDDPGAADALGPECPGDVATAGGLRQPALTRRASGPSEERLER